MACETTNTYLNAKTAVLTIASGRDDLAGRCVKCGRSCCNCELCLKVKGRPNVCGPCFRVEQAAAAKKGAA